MLLDQLLKMIPSDTEERIRRTRDRFNQNIREAIRQETGLRFRPREGETKLERFEAVLKDARWQLRGQEAAAAEKAEREAAEA